MGAFFGICIFIFCFWLIIAAIAKWSKANIKSKTGIIATPESLDETAKSIRKLIDKKYRVKREIEDELERKLNFTYSKIQNARRDYETLTMFNKNTSSTKNNSTIKDPKVNAILNEILNKSPEENLKINLAKLEQEMVEIRRDVLQKAKKKYPELDIEELLRN